MIEWLGRVAGPARCLALTVLVFVPIAFAVRRRWPSAVPLDRLLATTLLGFVGIIIGLESLSFFHAISIVGLTVVAVALGAGGLLLGLSAPAGHIDALVPEAAPRLLLPALAATGLSAWALLLYLARGLILPVQTVSDAPIYHLYFAARWREAGSLVMVPTPFGELAATYFPANGDLWLTWLMVSAGSDFLARAGQWPFTLVAFAALWGLGCWAGGDRSGALFPPALWSSSFLVLYSSSLATVDLCLAAWYLVAVYFLARAWDERQDPLRAKPHFLCFAFAAGAAVGTKSIGCLFILPLLPPAMAIVARGPRRLRLGAQALVAFLLPCVYWYGRNACLTANPLYPLAVTFWGIPVLPGWYDRSAMLASGYHLPVTDWELLAGRLALVLDGRLLALWLLATLGALIRASLGKPRPLVLAALGAVIWLLFWFVNPYNSQERFLIAGFGCGLVPLAPILAGRTWLQWGCAVLLASHLLTPPPMMGLAGAQATGPIPIPLARDPLSQGSVPRALVLPAAVGLALLAARRRRRLLAGLLLVSGAIASTWPSIRFMSDHPRAHYLPGTDFGQKLLEAWTIIDEASGPEGARVAYAGTNLPYYLLGADLRNLVRYVHVSEPSSGLAHEADQARRQAGETVLAADPWPGWYRERPDFARWLDNLQREKIEVLLIARENVHGRLDAAEGLPAFPIEAQWARAHPERFKPMGPARGDRSANGPSSDWAQVYRLRP